MADRYSTERAVRERDAAVRRERRLTGGLVAAAVALSGVFTGVAASSTHARRIVRQVRPASKATPALPAMPAAPAGPAGSSSGRGSDSAPPPAPSPPPQPPVPAPAPPVVTSGGS